MLQPFADEVSAHTVGATHSGDVGLWTGQPVAHLSPLCLESGHSGTRSECPLTQKRGHSTWLCEQAHSALIDPAVGFGVFRDDRLWLLRFSSITAEMIPSAQLVGCTIGSLRRSGRKISSLTSTASRPGLTS